MSVPERIDSIVDVELDVLAIGHLDFDPQCQSLDEFLLVVGSATIPLGQRRCSNQSSWIATCVACRHRSFSCDVHHDRMGQLTAECGQCGASGPGFEAFAFSPLSGGV